MKVKTHITESEHASLVYAIDFMNDRANGMDDKAAKRIHKTIGDLQRLVNRSKQTSRLLKKADIKNNSEGGASPVLPAVDGCIRRRIFLQGPKKYYGREVCEELVFKVTGTFESMYAAELWLSEKGYSVGSTCAMAPRGILKGDYLIAKWKNLTVDEKRTLDGIVEGDMREGPVTVSIYYTSGKDG